MVDVKSQQVETTQSFFLVDSRARTLLLGIVLILITIAVYSPVHGYTFFSLDDHFYVLDNVHIHNGLDWTTVRWAFTSFDHANWIPLSFLSHALDYQLFGPDPAGHHDVNMILHALNAALLFWVLKRATGYVGRSFMVAALFALHPVNVEAVAWVAERKTVLSMFFFLLALEAYRWYAKDPGRGRFWIVAGLFALGLMAKAQIITLPFVLLLWDYWPLQRMFPSGQEPSPYPKKSLRWLITDKIPLLPLCLVDAYFTLLTEGVARPRFWPPFTERLGNAIFSYARYIEITFWPSGLVPMYPNPGSSLTAWQIGVAFLLLLAITTLVVVAGRRHRYLIVGWLLFLGTLVPTLQIIQFGKEGMADRFAYQALIGLFIMLCWGISDLASQHNVSRAWLAAGGGAALLALTLVTHHQLGYWKDPHTMWIHASQVVNNHWEAQDQLGLELAEQGKPDEAMAYFYRAAIMDPDDSLSNLRIALYEQKHGHPQEAITRYEHALRDPAVPYDQLPHIYHNMSIAYDQIGDYANAREYATKSADLLHK